jgi:methionyl aminopeptidase
MDDEIKEKYLKAGSIASKVRNAAKEMVKENALALVVAEFVESETEKLGAKPAFPVNIAINDVAAHYTPHSSDELRFKRGDVVKLDIGVHVDGYIADTAVTVEVSTTGQHELIFASSSALGMVLESIRPGMMLKDIGMIVEGAIQSKGFQPVSNLSGHSLERYNLHAGLSIPNVMDGSVEELKTGMAIAIEPFASTGAGRVVGKKNGNIYRQVRTRDLPDKELNDLAGKIQEEFRGLPFSERWLARQCGNSEKALKKLMRLGAIAPYPILKDARGGLVSQAEHTVLLVDNKIIITTT